jgi:hypothetical protein
MAIVRFINRLLGTALLGAALAACNPVNREPFTAEEQASASVAGVPDARFWADSEAAARAADRLARAPFKEFSYLALSGGGGDGAFGAGMLKGWTQSGKRPEFTVVSGVSTGALIAPFAFLGSAYDETLRDMYTGGYGITLVDSPDLINAVFGSGVFDSSRMLTLARQFVTDDVIAAIAREHRKGRRLLVLTTSLDTQRPVIWNMGAIAASGVPGSEELFRRIMTASASIPGIFTPTYITTEANGRQLEEMHVDGGVVSNVFILPDDLLVRNLRLSMRSKGNVYVIMNGKLAPSFDMVDGKTTDIVGRAVSTMTQTHSRGTLQATYDFTRRNGMGFHLTSIPPDVKDGGTIAFDTDEMRRLYAYGVTYAASKSAWSSTPFEQRPPTASIAAATRP